MRIVEHRIDGNLHYLDLDCPEIETRAIARGATRTSARLALNLALVRGRTLHFSPTFEAGSRPPHTDRRRATHNNGLWVIRAKFRDGSIGITEVLGGAGVDPRAFEIVGPCTAKIEP